MNPIQEKIALDDVRVLDLTGPSGVYCTKLLADLGADVIRVEPPGGDPSRRVGPFVHDEPSPEKSLHFMHYNTNKRSVTLNIETVAGREIFKKLVKTADMMVETFQPGYLASIGLEYPVLKEINPRLILVSISWFGQDSPYKDFQASDLIVQAMTGLMYTIGFPEDPPAAIGAVQTYHMAATHAAMGALMALYHQEATGSGQWVDVPVEGACMRMADMVALMYWIEGTVRKRSGFEYYRGLQDVWECKDGSIICSALGGAGADGILEWMNGEGLAGDLLSEEYADVVAAIKGAAGGGRGGKKGAPAPKLRDLKEAQKHVEEIWQAFLLAHTREELFVGAQERGVVLMPINTAKGIVEDVGLRERGYFVDVEHPELGSSIKYPGPPYRLDATPWSIRKRAPLIGEHNIEVYEEIGFSREQLAEMVASEVI
ncbi:MAG: CoA transferase [Deltaproteobacteria bacterium]|nr:CoA transferase [Deltaproteobacteria bacterium]